MTMPYVIVNNSINPGESKRFTVMQYMHNAKTIVCYIFKQVSCEQATLRCLRIGSLNECLSRTSS